MNTLQVENPILKLTHLESQISELKEIYRANSPFPHIRIENFLPPLAIEKVSSEFPLATTSEWLHYKHVNEKKLGLKNLDQMPAFTKALIEELLSDRFTRFLSQLTGIPNLRADRSLEGGGLHQIQTGGFLNIHADFTAHHRIPNWKRRVNFLLYLNKDWDTDWNGSLELWNKDMKNCAVKYAPYLNHAVIFTTADDTFHGHPDPLTCPQNVTRKSIALYYFTEDTDAKRFARSTNYQPRPTDGFLKRFLIRIDREAVGLYSRSKARFNISDEAVSKILKFF